MTSTTTYLRAPGEKLVSPTASSVCSTCYVRYLRVNNQINGSYYRRLRALGTQRGLDAIALPHCAGPARLTESLATDDNAPEHVVERGHSDPRRGRQNRCGFRGDRGSTR